MTATGTPLGPLGFAEKWRADMEEDTPRGAAIRARWAAIEAYGARHEAAHAVAAVHFRYRINDVTMAPGGTHHGRTRCWPPGQLAGPHPSEMAVRRYYQFCRAGDVAAADLLAPLMVTGPPEPSLGTSDAERETWCLAHLSDDAEEQAAWRALLDLQTRVLVGRYREAIDAIAAALVSSKSKTLSGRQVRGIVRRNPPVPIGTLPKSGP